MPEPNPAHVRAGTLREPAHIRAGTRRARQPPPDQVPVTPPRVPPDPAPGEILPGLRTTDATPHVLSGRLSQAEVNGKYPKRSLMQPQPLAERLLPAEEYERLLKFAQEGCPAECGPDWDDDVIQAARQAGPHVSALDPDNLDLIWEDITYQQKAGFVSIVTADELFDGHPPDLKISRVAVVPQNNRRGRIILNLSAEVDMGYQKVPGRRRKKQRIHPSVNQTTEPADDQTSVKALGTALASILSFMYETNPSWEIDWQKIDLSDGFWRMIVADGKEYNFVFQLPRRPGDTQDMFVVPSSLQMGWKNSPAFFCTGTEATRTLIKRLLALTVADGIPVEHRHEGHCVPPCTSPSPTPFHFHDAMVLSRVYVDDFLNGLAGDPDRPERRAQQTWVARASMHAIHAIFPPPDVLGHVGGKDSISEKKLKQGDAWFDLLKIMLGFLMHGGRGPLRTVGVPDDKFGKYTDRIHAALAQPHNWIPFSEFQRIHGQVQHVSVAVPCLKGLMTPLNRVLSQAPRHVGLSRGKPLRNTLGTMATLLADAQTHPSHITEIVPPDIPHFYGSVDAAAVGVGGVWLPCTHWIHPTVWRADWPPDITRAVREGRLTMVDCEYAGYFIQECMLEDVSDIPTAGISSFVWTDNSPTSHIVQRQATRATSPMPETTLRWMALRQRWTRRGPQDIEHYEGAENKMADFASRSFEEGYPSADDDAFFEEFTHRFPLPPQLRYWVFARPRAEIFSAAISLLRNQIDNQMQQWTVTGGFGVALPKTLAATFSSALSRPTAPPTHWGERLCSWPLLLPSGVVSTTMATFLRERRSRTYYSESPNAWCAKEFTTLANRIRPPTD